MAVFDPNQVGITSAGLFGFGHDVDDADILVLPVPWDVTTSYRDGTSNAPAMMLEASSQLDFYYPDFPNLFETPIAMLPISSQWHAMNTTLRRKATRIINAQESGTSIQDFSSNLKKDLALINQQSQLLNDWVFHTTRHHLSNGKSVVLLGGDHSTPLGYIRAISEQHRQPFGILHIDAHMDFRLAYEGFQHSHASIMRNVLTDIPLVSKLTQLGIRDCCHEEVLFSQNDSRIQVFYNQSIQESLFSGLSWRRICTDIIKTLPQSVYISLDVDGLSPLYCPSTGTPVPGGLSFDQCLYLIKRIRLSGRQIIGFDLVETGAGPHSFLDATVSCRLLYQLIGYMHTDSHAFH